MSRNILDLTPDTQILYRQFKEGMDAAGIDFILTCTLRTAAEQLELYRKGREYREGKWITVDKKKCVTWTLNSRHLKGTAFDICILVNGKLLWNPGLDADGDGVPEYTEAGIIGEKVGLKWGGRFKDKNGNPNPDAPHFQNGG